MKRCLWENYAYEYVRQIIWVGWYACIYVCMSVLYEGIFVNMNKHTQSMCLYRYMYENKSVSVYVWDSIYKSMQCVIWVCEGMCAWKWMSTSGLQQYVMCLALGKEASSWNNRCSLGSRLPLLQSKWLLPAEGGHQEAHSWAGLPGSGVDLMKCPSHLSGAFAKPIHSKDTTVSV